MILSAPRVLAGLVLSLSLVSCLEEEGSVIYNLEEKLDVQAYDLEQMKGSVEAERAKLARLKKAEINRVEAGKLRAVLEKVQEVQKEAESRNAELSDQMSLTELELSQYQRAHRVQVRKSSVGKKIDLSETKGEDFKAARIMSITPLSLRVMISSGTQAVPFAELPESVRELLGMSEEEAEVIFAKRAAMALARAERWKKWKAGQVRRDKESSMAAILQQMEEKRLEITQLKSGITLRLNEMKAWKSKASGFETQAFEAQKRGKPSGRWLKRSDLARAKAETLGDLNSHAWILVTRLKEETAELKKMGDL